MNFLNFLAPRYCAFCAESIEGTERSICSGCYADLPWATPTESPTPGALERSISMLDYEFPIDAAIKALKFSRKLYYSPAFGEILCAARDSLPPDIDAVLPVPLHWWRKARRGFNQATEIAHPVARMLNVPLVRCACRSRATPFQSGLGAAERARNLRGAFALKGPIAFQHILIIDDVVTTGATLTQLAKTLRRGKVAKVSALSVARAH